MKQNKNISNEEKKQKLAKKLLINFIVIMFVLTIISKTFASIITPIVYVENINGGTVTKKITANGVIKADDEINVNFKEQFLVDKINEICDVKEVHTYETILDYNKKEEIINILDSNKVDYITFASSSSVVNFVHKILFVFDIIPYYIWFCKSLSRFFVLLFTFFRHNPQNFI